MTKQTDKIERRKNYSIDPIMSRQLARQAINMEEELGKTVRKQTILDILISLLNDRKTYDTVRNEIEKRLNF